LKGTGKGVEGFRFAEKRRVHKFTDCYDTHTDLKSFHLDRYFFSNGIISSSISPSFFFTNLGNRNVTQRAKHGEEINMMNMMTYQTLKIVHSILNAKIMTVIFKLVCEHAHG
jgi:hypothetical protein